MKIAFDFSRAVLDFAERVSSGTLEGVRGLLAGSLQWSADQLEELARATQQQGWKAALPEGFADGLAGQVALLRQAENGTRETLSAAISSTGQAFQNALETIHLADDATRRALFENIPVSSVVGESFASLIPTSKIQASFRLITNGRGQDVSVDAVAADHKMFRMSRGEGARGIVLCVPGLFCDESVWEDSGITLLLKDEGLYPVCLRFNPGAHISSNGQAVRQLCADLLAHPEFEQSRLDAITYSQGGLVLRSMLYYDGSFDPAKSVFRPGPLAKRIGRAILINSPDGGSYLEKLGYWLGLGMQYAPIFSLKAAGFIGNQRSDAIKDLSHGIIREEDWQSDAHSERYGREFYFGELDHVDAYQIYSLVAQSDGPWEAWIGDGIVEAPSLAALSDRVYRAKAEPAARVRVIKGKSHFQIIHTPETRALIREILTGASAANASKK